MTFPDHFIFAFEPIIIACAILGPIYSEPNRKISMMLVICSMIIETFALCEWAIKLYSINLKTKLTPQYFISITGYVIVFLNRDVDHKKVV